MAARKSHKDVEFMVSSMGRDSQFNTFAEAAHQAVALAASSGSATIDVLVYSRAGAKWYGGDHGVEVYNEDPEASVHDRIELTANPVGRVA